MNQQYNIQQNIFSLSKAVYPFEFKIVVKWPDTIIHNGIRLNIHIIPNNMSH